MGGVKCGVVMPVGANRRWWVEKRVEQSNVSVIMLVQRHLRSAGAIYPRTGYVLRAAQRCAPPSSKISSYNHSIAARGQATKSPQNDQGERLQRSINVVGVGSRQAKAVLQRARLVPPPLFDAVAKREGERQVRVQRPCTCSHGSTFPQIVRRLVPAGETRSRP